MSMSRKVLAKHDDNDFNDCVNCGYMWTLYADGHISAEYVTRWQGTRNGVRYVSEPGYVDFEHWQGFTPEETLKAVRENIDDLTLDYDFRITDNGYVVQ